MERHLSYFASDTHLGLDAFDARDREMRFVSFLRSINNPQTKNLFLLGDIFDFWYEYKYVVPKGFARVIAALEDLVLSGVKVYYFKGNHDVWAYHYFQQLGMTVLGEPTVFEIGGKKFCLAHGDCLGPVPFGVRFLHGIFHCKILQRLFDTLHARIAFGFGLRWSKSNRLARGGEYTFQGPDEALYKYAEGFDRKVDYFIFGHYHVNYSTILPSGAGFFILKDWMKSSPYAVFDSSLKQLSISDK